jgi:hypothetical protein
MRVALFHVAAVSLAANVALANELEVSILKSSDDGADTYQIDLEATKTGASACSLTTPEGTYPCSAVTAGALQLPPAFFSDHTYSGVNAFSDLLVAIGTDWTLTWDPGEGTETVASICFGSGWQESDFLEVPILSQPADGSTGAPITTGMTWGYGATPACTAQTDRVEASMIGPGGAERDSDELPCSSTTWTPSPDLTAGEWIATITNAHDPGPVVSGWLEAPDASSCTAPTGDPWSLTNEDWLGLASIDSATFRVANPIPALSGNGAIALIGALLLAGMTAIRGMSSGSR